MTTNKVTSLDPAFAHLTDEAIECVLNGHPELIEFCDETGVGGSIVHQCAHCGTLV